MGRHRHNSVYLIWGYALSEIILAASDARKMLDAIELAGRSDFQQIFAEAVLFAGE